MLKIENLSIRYEREILNNINFSLERGSVIGIVGANGEGKSSLLRVISGFQDASEGDVFWNDKRVQGPAYRLVPGHDDIQLVNQDFHLDLFHTVEENVRNAMLYLTKELQDSFSKELLDLVNLTDLGKQQARYLSGGEKQRLAIARALASEPDVILLDEPFSHLDAHLKLKLGVYLQELAKVRELLVILVSHDGADIMEWCQQVIFIAEKGIARIASPKDFYFEPTNEYEALFFGEVNKAKVDGREVLFRPTEYRKNKTLGVKAQLISTQFCGFYYRNVVRTNNKTLWRLYSSKPFAEISYIQISMKKK